MKTLLKALLVCSSFYSSGITAQTVYGTKDIYSKEQLRQDFTQLRLQLEKKHVNLYLYTPKPRADAFFDSLYNAIKTPMTALQFYALITPLSNIIKNGHSYILPGEKERNYYNKHNSFLPLHIVWVNGRMYSDMNCSAGNTVPEGAEIISINNVPAESIMQTLLARQVRDGYNVTYPVWILNNYFREYYSYIYGHPEIFTVQYKDNDGAVTSATMHALPKDSIKYQAQIKYAARLASQDEKAVNLSFTADSTTGILTIKTFDDEQIKELYQQDFKAEIQHCFTLLARHNTAKLIVDLRNNQGGDPPNGILLLSYLLNKPFEMIHKGPVATGIFQPQKNNYKGALYVLINGGSFSNTGMVCACLKANSRGYFIGEEAGGNNCLLSGDTETFTLPHTGITFEIATAAYLLNNKIANTGHGVMPNLVMQPTIQDIVYHRDAVLNAALQLAARP